MFRLVSLSIPRARALGPLLFRLAALSQKGAVLGPNSGVKLLAPDGFAQQSTIDLAAAREAVLEAREGLVEHFEM